MTAAATSADRNDTAFLGHPKALAYLAFTEAWERFSDVVAADAAKAP